MKLTRFELHDDPGTARSGIYHDSRFYETDGEKAAGIYDPGAIKLLPPIGTPPSVRLFDEARDANGELFLTYTFGNPARLQGPNSDIDASGTDESLDFDVRVGVILQAEARRIELQDASKLVLGYGLLLCFYEPEEAERLVSLGLSDAPARDVAMVFGPFLCTPDELLEHRVGADPLEFGWSMTISVNGENVHQQTLTMASFSTMMSVASVKGPVFPGEVLASPPIQKPAMANTTLGRHLIATDRVSVTVEPLGTLVGRII